MLSTLTHWLTGEFDNRTQALQSPTWFVHLRLWHRLLPIQIDGHPAVFAEQANVVYLDQPYRQRVMVLQETGNLPQLQVQYLAFHQPERFKGAGANPDLLNLITPADLEVLPGCRLMVIRQGDCFRAQPEPDSRCCFQYNGETRQVVLGFEVGDRHFHSYDKGIDPETGKPLWGALMGPYEFVKR